LNQKGGRRETCARKESERKRVEMGAVSRKKKSQKRKVIREYPIGGGFCWGEEGFQRGIWGKGGKGGHASKDLLPPKRHSSVTRKFPALRW